MLRRALVAGPLLIAVLPFLPSPAAAQPTAQSVADSLTQALGGQKAWDDTHYLHWTFAGRRVEGTTQAGEKYVVVENLNTKEGTAWLNGQKLEGEKAAEMLKNAYGAWVNDSYWLIAPYKIHDPGVNLSYGGEETVDGKTYDKLALSFEHVGLTPGDRYWLYVNRETHLMDRWAFILESMPKEGPPSGWIWDGWQKFGGVMLAPHRTQVGGEARKLELGEISVAAIPDAAFTSPAPVK